MIVAGLFAIATCVALASFSTTPSLSKFSAHSMLRRAVDFGKRSFEKQWSKQQFVVYPYSIVAGGIHSQQELRQAIGSDPVAAGQYASFNLAKTRVAALRHDEYAYVSFRVGDDVYWTRGKVKLRKGEMLITDGKNFGRARCGNRLSKTARLPFYRDERLVKTLDAPMKPGVETEAFTMTAAPDPAFEMPGESPEKSFLGTARETVFTSASGFADPGVALIFPPPGCDPATKCTDSKNSSTPSPPSPPRPSPTPETSCWMLVGTGLAALTLYRMIESRMEKTG
ncbi:MAG: hypothetical protein ACRD10_08700 [Terriglobia bacterium]